MKFIHTGDLHIGKSIFERNLYKDQEHMLRQLLDLAKTEAVDAFIIAGDIYDRSVPSTEAVELFDGFLTELSEENIPVLMISGNHDSAVRVSFAGKILEKQSIYIGGSYELPPGRVILKDDYGEVDFYLLPFVKPGMAGESNSQDAVKKMVEEAKKDAGWGEPSRRRVCITHYFVTNKGHAPELSQAETTIQVGNIDNVDAACFTEFDYTALGHIHKRQQIGENPVYYAGSPMKYAFSEWNQTKSVNLVTIEEKGRMKVEYREVTPLHDMRKIKGELRQLIEAAGETGNSLDYIQAILTNEEEVYEPMSSLRSVYQNICQIIIEKHEKKNQEESAAIKGAHPVETSPLELFQRFYEEVALQKIDDRRMEIVAQTMKEAE